MHMICDVKVWESLDVVTSFREKHQFLQVFVQKLCISSTVGVLKVYGL